MTAQEVKKINKNYFACELSTGLSFADFDDRQSFWQPSFYPVASLGLMWTSKINGRLEMDFGAGGTFYYLVNKGSLDRYVLDFASPYLISGLGFNFLQTKFEEFHFKLSGIIQVGYNDSFTEELQDYSVFVKSDSKYYYSIKSQIGFKKYVKNKRKSRSDLAAIEYGSYFRFSLQNLGTATFVGPNYIVDISPSGDIVGIYLKFLISYGGRKVKRKVKIDQQKKSDEIPKIYNPRF